jgi:hypothetical protein
VRIYLLSALPGTGQGREKFVSDDPHPPRLAGFLFRPALRRLYVAGKVCASIFCRHFVVHLLCSPKVSLESDYGFQPAPIGGFFIAASPAPARVTGEEVRRRQALSTP